MLGSEQCWIAACSIDGMGIWDEVVSERWSNLKCPQNDWRKEAIGGRQKAGRGGRLRSAGRMSARGLA